MPTKGLHPSLCCFYVLITRYIVNNQNKMASTGRNLYTTPPLIALYLWNNLTYNTTTWNMCCEGLYLVEGFNWTSELMCGIFRRRNVRFWRSRPKVYLPRYVAQSINSNKRCFVYQKLCIMPLTQEIFHFNIYRPMSVMLHSGNIMYCIPFPALTLALCVVLSLSLSWRSCSSRESNASSARVTWRQHCKGFR